MGHAETILAHAAARRPRYLGQGEVVAVAGLQNRESQLVYVGPGQGGGLRQHLHPGHGAVDGGEVGQSVILHLHA